MMLYIMVNRKRKCCNVPLNSNKMILKGNGKVQGQLNTARNVTESLTDFTLPQSKSNQSIRKEK